MRTLSWLLLLGGLALGAEPKVLVGWEFDPGPFEEYECICVREDRLWRKSDGRTGFSAETPTEIKQRADAIRSGAS